jgi:hypothetical protein
MWHSDIAWMGRLSAGSSLEGAQESLRLLVCLVLPDQVSGESKGARTNVHTDSHTFWASQPGFS